MASSMASSSPCSRTLCMVVMQVRERPDAQNFQTGTYVNWTLSNGTVAPATANSPQTPLQFSVNLQDQVVPTFLTGPDFTPLPVSHTHPCPLQCCSMCCTRVIAAVHTVCPCTATPVVPFQPACIVLPSSKSSGTAVQQWMQTHQQGQADDHALKVSPLINDEMRPLKAGLMVRSGEWQSPQTENLLCSWPQSDVLL